MQCSKCPGLALLKADGSSYGYCKPCKNEYNRQHYARNKPYYFEKARRSQQRLHAWVRKLKERPCTDCGRRYPYYVMDFDHCRGEKLIEIAQAVGANLSRERIEAEIKKCDVVCANCHRKRTHKRKQRSRSSVGLEHSPPKRKVARSNRAEITEVDALVV